MQLAIISYLLNLHEHFFTYGHCKHWPQTDSCSTYCQIIEVYISQLICFDRASSHATDFNNRNKLLTAKLLKQGYRYHKLRKAFSKCYRRNFELIEKYHVSLKKTYATTCQQGICNPEFYGDLVYKFKKIIGNPNFCGSITSVGEERANLSAVVYL